MYIYTPKYNLVSLHSVPYMYVYRAINSVLDN